MAARTRRPRSRMPEVADSDFSPTASAGFRALDSSHAAFDGISRRPVRVWSDSDIIPTFPGEQMTTETPRVATRRGPR